MFYYSTHHTLDVSILTCTSGIRAVYYVFFRLCGGYDKLVGGFLADALIDLTGGIVEAVDVQGTNTIPPAVPDKLFVDMKKAFDANVPMTAAVSVCRKAIKFL